MKKLVYIEEEFLTPQLCKKFIDFAVSEREKEVPYGNEERGGDTYITNIDFGGNLYQGGIPDCIELDDYKMFEDVITSITNICEGFDSNIRLDYSTIIRWPSGTFMKPHYDNSYRDNPDVFSSILYLNDDFDGGHTCFEEFEVKPKTGKLVIFSNSKYLHHVSKVEGGERFVLSLWYSGLTPPTHRAMIPG